jgi:glycosyltransferase involved in cell wall biosynthesis
VTLTVSLLVPGLNRGGMTRAYVLAGALRAAGARVEIVGALADGETVYPEPPAGLPIVALPERSFVERVLDAQEAATGDVLYAVKARVTSFGVALLIRRGRPVMVDLDDWESSFPHRMPHMHGSIASRARRVVRRWSNPDHPRYSRWMESRLMRASAVTANTRLLAGRCDALYLPSGKDLGLFDPARFNDDDARRALGLDGYRVIMFPGTVREHKGLDDVMVALDILQWNDARVVLVGGRDAGDIPARALEEKHPHRIVRLGRFASDAMPGVVAAAHVVVAPQRDTPTARAQCPMKLTDAMAMAKPIVTTRVGDIPAVLDGAAHLVAPGAPAEIATALRDIFDHPDEAARRGRLARERCRLHHSYESLGVTLAPLLQNIIDGGWRVSGSGSSFAR